MCFCLFPINAHLSIMFCVPPTSIYLSVYLSNPIYLPFYASTLHYILLHTSHSITLLLCTTLCCFPCHYICVHDRACIFTCMWTWVLTHHLAWSASKFEISSGYLECLNSPGYPWFPSAPVGIWMLKASVIATYSNLVDLIGNQGTEMNREIWKVALAEPPNCACELRTSSHSFHQPCMSPHG
jgi:hypothetical protein